MEDRKRVLIVDDEEDLRNLLALALTQEGYEVLTASDGRQALTMLGSQQVDVLISDVMMPMIDGYHLAQEVHEAFGEKAPKIVLMTSRDTATEHSVAMMAGADAFVQKPFKLDGIKKTLADVLAPAGG